MLYLSFSVAIKSEILWFTARWAGNGKWNKSRKNFKDNKIVRNAIFFPNPVVLGLSVLDNHCTRGSWGMISCHFQPLGTFCPSEVSVNSITLTSSLSWSLPHIVTSISSPLSFSNLSSCAGLFFYPNVSSFFLNQKNLSVLTILYKLEVIYVASDKFQRLFSPNTCHPSVGSNYID